MSKFEHINRALPTSGHTPMYVMHKFFARKQADVIREYIKTYSKEGEIVLDPFCGSGVMVGEAVRLNRKAIGVDINPVSIFVTRNTLEYIDTKEILDEFEHIKNDISHEINNLFRTHCRMCKKSLVFAICFTLEGDKLIDVRYNCTKHGNLISQVDKYDIDLYEKIRKRNLVEFFDEDGNCKFWFPKERLFYSDGTPFLKKERFNSVDEIFTLRNLICLAKLYERIEKIQDISLRDAFKYAFSSMTHLASKMTVVRPSRPFSSAWVQQSYWAVPYYMESNVWLLFKRAILDRQSLTKAKEDLFDDFKDKNEAKSIKDLTSTSYHHYLLARSAIDALDDLKENSVDFVITDPPYGNSIQYAELLYMWGCWLKLMNNFDEIARGEVIVNPRQNKNDAEYQNMLYVAFRKIFKVLKPNRYCTVTFHNPSLKYRNILFRAAIMAGFEFEKIIYQPPPRASVKSLLQPFGSLSGDYFFRFKKLKIRKEEGYKTVDQKRVEILIVDITKRIIAKRGEPTQYTFIQNSIDPMLYEELRKYGLLMDFQPESVESILKKYVGEIFQLVDMSVGGKGRKSLLVRGWWFLDPNEYRLDIPLNKRVDEAIVNLLMRERKVTFTEVLTEIYTRFQNALTPEEYTIKDILEENAVMVSGGKWEIKPFIKQIQEMHEEMVFILAKIGEKIGLKVDIASDEYGKSLDGKRLDSLLDLTKIELKGVKKNQLNRIKSIDVIWHNEKEIVAEFEVEHSTSIVDAVIRGSNIPSKNISRLMVIPEEREDLVFRRFMEPAMKAIMKDSEWDIITYNTLRRYYVEHKKKGEIDFDDFISIACKPTSKESRKKAERKLDHFFEHTSRARNQ